MKEYIKRLRKNFFLWQTKLFGNLITFFFFSFFFLLEEFRTTLDYSENIFVFHLPAAWLSLFLYILLLGYYWAFNKKLTRLFFVSFYVSMATVLSGVCWGKLSFGFLIFYDSKILAYVFLPIFLIYLYLTPPRPGILCWGIGLFLLCQERLSTYFLNSLHQVFILDMFSDSEFTVKTISLGKATIVILVLTIFCLKI